MSNELAIRDDMSLSEIGKVFYASGFFQDVKSEAQAIVKIVAGKELGFGPMASMKGIYIIQGQPSLSANLIGAAIKRTTRYNYRVKEISEKACTIEFYEGGQLCGNSTFTIDDARKAGTKNLDKFPRNMLFARAITNGARWYCPDVFGGPIYTPEELGATVNEAGEVIEVETKGTDAVQEAKDTIRKVEANSEKVMAQVKGNGNLTLAEAMAITNSQNVMYGDLPTDKLSMMANAIEKKLADGGYDSQNQDTYIRKLEAIKLILADRTEKATQAG